MLYDSSTLVHPGRAVRAGWWLGKAEFVLNQPPHPKSTYRHSNTPKVRAGRDNNARHRYHKPQMCDAGTIDGARARVLAELRSKNFRRWSVAWMRA